MATHALDQSVFGSVVGGGRVLLLEHQSVAIPCKTWDLCLDEEGSLFE